MAHSELREPLAVASPCIEALMRGDTEAGLALSDAAGWNQTADDWAFFIGAGRAIGIRNDDRRLVATAASFGDGNRAWVSLVLVAAASRHRGLASTLVARCIEQVAQRRETAVLDATPAGAAVYSRLGFAPGFAFSRWARAAHETVTMTRPHDGHGVSSVQQAWLLGPHHAVVLDRIAALDLAAQQRDRRSMLASFLARPETRVWLSDDGRGFAVARAGRRAWQIGPVVAADDACASALLRAALDTLPSLDGVYVDVPADRTALADILVQRGFAVQRPFVRMALGDASASRLSLHSHVLAGPEYG